MVILILVAPPSGRCRDLDGFYADLGGCYADLGGRCGELDGYCASTWVVDMPICLIAMQI